MTCLACRDASREAICRRCLGTLRRAPDRIAGSVLVRSAFVHEGAARALVHRLKYEAVAGVADRLAATLEPLLPSGAEALVPVPRVHWRRLRYGVDPAVALAVAVGRRCGLPVSRALRPMWWAARRAGSAETRRGIQHFEPTGIRPGPDAVLVDDVVTTGTTLRSAASVTGLTHAVTVTAGHSSLTLRAAPQ